MPGLRTVLAVGGAEGRGDLDWGAALTAESARFTAEQTKADEAAVLIYTSGTTGPPKGALIPHRALIGNLTGFVCSQNWYPQEDAVFWSPADWAWTGGLFDALLPTWHFGMPILACIPLAVAVPVETTFKIGCTTKAMKGSIYSGRDCMMAFANRWR